MVEDAAATPADLIIASVPAPTTSAFSLLRNIGSPAGVLFGKKSTGNGQGQGGKGKEEAKIKLLNMLADKTGGEFFLKTAED